MRVEVYWNLHRRCYSVRALSGPDKGKVIRHLASLSLTDASFIVQPAGRAKVLRNKVKNVHAFVRGTLNHQTMPGGDVRVTYNPYRDETFVALPLGTERRDPIHKAEFVELDSASSGDEVMRPFIFAR